MKRLIKYSVLPLLAMLGVVGCSDDEGLGLTITPTVVEEITGSFNIVASVGDDTITPTTPQKVGSYVTFTDTSEEVVAREWRIEDRAKFLNESFDPTQDLSTQTDNNTTSQSVKESVYFGEPGYSTVTLFSQFTQNVGYENDAVKAIYYDGFWEVLTEVKIPIFATTITPKVRITILDGTEYIVSADDQNTTTIAVGMGDPITIEDITLDEGFTAEEIAELGCALSRTWSYASGEDTSNIIDTSTNFDEETTESTTLAVKGNVEKALAITVSRTEPFSLSSGPITLPVTFTASAEPITINSIEVTNQDGGSMDEIILTTNKDVAAISAFNGLTLNVTNNGSDVSSQVSISDVAVDTEDSKRIIISLSSSLYSDDVITLAYDGSNSITSPDGFSAIPSFAAKPVTNNITNVLSSVYGFENSTLNMAFGSDTFWYGGNTATYYKCVADPTDSDNKVAQALFTADTGTTMQYIMAKKNLGDAVSLGSYKASVRMYIPSTTAIVNANTKYSLAYDSTAQSSTWTAISTDTYPAERDQWVTLSGDVVLSSDATLQVRFLFASSTNGSLSLNTHIYIDDIEFTPIRPTN